MSQYPELLGTLMDAILTGQTADAPSFFREKQGFPSPKQLAVYTDGYRLRLHDVLTGAYPALAQYMGKQAFHNLATSYITQHPSRHFNIDRYPLAFANYVAIQSADGIAKDMAALESAIANVYMKDDSPAIAADWATRQTEESLASATLQPRAASALLSLHYPVNDYVNALRAETTLPPLTPKANWLLVYRHQNQVQRLELSAGEYTLLTLLTKNTPLAAALEDPQFTPYSEKALQSGEFMQWFSRWIEKGCLRQPCQTTP